MKKILFSLIALMAVVSVQAQSICGSWRSIQPVINTAADDSYTASSYTYTFNADGTYYEVVEETVSSEPAQTMALEVATILEIKGTYTYDGNQLKLMPNKNSYKSDVLSVSQNGRVTNNANIKSKVKKQINEGEIKSKLTGTKTMTVVSLDNMRLVMSDGGNKITFMRLALIKN